MSRTPPGEVQIADAGYLPKAAKAGGESLGDCCEAGTEDKPENVTRAGCASCLAYEQYERGERSRELSGSEFRAMHPQSDAFCASCADEWHWSHQEESAYAEFCGDRF